LRAKMEETGADLILLDIFFPTENGLDILAEIKRKYPRVKALMVTGLRQDTIWPKPSGWARTACYISRLIPMNCWRPSGTYSACS